MFARQWNQTALTLPKLKHSITLQNRQRTRRVDLKLLRAILHKLLDRLGIRQCELSVLLVAEKEITHLNEAFLRHKGSTDVITFNYLDSSSQTTIVGDVIVSVDEAVSQARRFRTTWQSELVRYVVHGVLHLLGYDDRRKTTRQKMRRAENALMRQLAVRHRLSAVSRDGTLRKRR